ncbi:MAG: phenylacetate--CoA ligase family protein [Verrucomicrobia bacterium]|nr:phenylacetate--CoA ligase family protein [Verrucomicrobiota bacterium]
MSILSHRVDNWRKPAYLTYATLRGYRFPSLLGGYLREYKNGLSQAIATRALRRLLRHCRERVPYYANLLRGVEEHQVDAEPIACLQRLPILTKDLIRADPGRLQSADLPRRRWHYNTSGGSTGEPVQLVQDDQYDDRSGAISLLYQSLLGCEVGEPLVRLWGSERDFGGGTASRKARFFNWLTNTTWLNAFHMSPERMRIFVQILDRSRPRLIVAYAQAAYELARWVEREKLPVASQRAVVTSAGTLHPFMREKIAQVFGCAVYNLYGSREVSDIACELPGFRGLWVAPWGNFVEIVDDAGQPVPAGTEGNILVTCLTNYAMPLLRYRIGDRGALLAPEEGRGDAAATQTLERVSGRTVDVFRTRDQTLVDGEYFTHLLYFRPWVWKFQVIQKSPAHIVFRVVRFNGEPAKSELEDITLRTRRVMGEDCRVDFEFAADLPPLPSGKYRYTISEIAC